MSLLHIHRELSGLLHAVQLELEDLGCEIEIRYRENLYLSVEVEMPLRHRQAVFDRLNRGAIQQDYDYRFSGISWTPHSEADWQHLSAYVNLHHPRRAA